MFSRAHISVVPKYSNLAENIGCCQMLSKRGKLLVKNYVVIAFQVAASLVIESTCKYGVHHADCRQQNTALKTYRHELLNSY